MTQQEMQRRIKRLEERVESVEDKKDRQQAILLEKWQVWIGVAAIIISLIVSLLAALMR